MALVDGLTFFADDEGPDWKRTLELEERGQEMVRLVEKLRDCPDAAAQQFAHRLLIDIEAWKGMCMRERMVNAVQNTPASVWAAFYGAVIGKTDLTKIDAIMGLKGFGQSVDEETGMRRAKVASSVLRFLYPMEWGVVDWRTLAIRSGVQAGAPMGAPLTITAVRHARVLAESGATANFEEISVNPIDFLNPPAKGDWVTAWGTQFVVTALRQPDAYGMIAITLLQRGS